MYLASERKKVEEPATIDSAAAGTVVDENLPLQHDSVDAVVELEHDRPSRTTFASRRRLQMFKDFMSRFLTAPLLATVIGLFIGLISTQSINEFQF